MASSISTRLLLASTSGIAFSSIFIGANFALTYIALPTILLRGPAAQPSNTSSNPQPASNSGLLARQWANMYAIGSRAGPLTALPAALSFLYASRLCPPASSGALSLAPRNLFLAAAIFNILIIPFTLVVMQGTNDELHRRANAAIEGKDKSSSRKEGEKEGSVESLETSDLITYWGRLNVVRAGLHVTALGLGVAALVI